MANYAYERLSAKDVSFLLFETPNTPMHLAWTWVFDARPLLGPEGGVDIARIRRHVESRLYRFPRFRQRLAVPPLDGHPVWVDDAGFKLHYHVRHVSLPEPGDDARLKTTTSSIVSQPLDRSKPLWELWVVEGLDGGRFAIVSKTHHCMVDGVSTVDLMTDLLDAEARAEPGDPVDWIPRPAPAPAALMWDAFADRVLLGCEVGRDAVVAAGQAPRVRAADLAAAGRELGRTVADGFRRAPETPFNRPVGPHRWVNWTRLSLGRAREIGRRLGGTVNDVALATVAGALRALLRRRGQEDITGPLRVVVPVHQRRDGERGMLGNRAAGWILPLPVDRPGPVARLHAVAEETARVKADPGRLNGDPWLRVAELAGSTVLGLGVALRRRLHSYNLIVTNIPGPREPRHLLGARLLEAYPQLPLFEQHGLAIAVASYLDQLHVGVTADWEIVPDLAELVRDLEAAFDELGRAALHGRPREA
jgi:diacylglycerol O-acyltransferase / wax synthase